MVHPSNIYHHTAHIFLSCEQSSDGLQQRALYALRRDIDISAINVCDTCIQLATNININHDSSRASRAPLLKKIFFAFTTTSTTHK